MDPVVRLAAARKIVEAAADHGIPASDIVVDPLVMPIGALGQADHHHPPVELVAEALDIPKSSIAVIAGARDGATWGPSPVWDGLSCDITGSSAPRHTAIASCCCACVLAAAFWFRSLSRFSQTHQHIESRNTPAINAAVRRTHVRRANGGLTGTGS